MLRIAIEGCGAVELTLDYADQESGGGGSRFFKQFRRNSMAELPQELWDYLKTLISPPASCDPLILIEPDLMELGIFEDSSVHGMILSESPEGHMEDIDRILRPGAHLLLVAPESDSTGFRGACAVEDFGFEIRDSIAILDAPGDFHYIAKASTSERNAGVAQRQDSSGREVQNDHPCLHPEDLVMTVFGFRPIQEISQGDFVYAQNGKFCEVEFVSSHPYTSTHLFEIRVSGTNLSIRASDNHLLLLNREGKSCLGRSQRCTSWRSNHDSVA